MCGATTARCCNSQGAITLAHQSNQFCQAARWQTCCDLADHGQNTHQANGAEITLYVIGDICLQHGIGRERPAGAKQKRISIGWRTRDQFRPKATASAGAVFDDDWPAQAFRHGACNQAGQDIRVSTSGEGHDHANGAVWIGHGAADDGSRGQRRRRAQ